MKHVADRLAAWLAGELDQTEAAAVATHLEGCAACRREAEAQRRVWDALLLSAAESPRPSVWPAVRARTVAATPGWFFGGGAVTRAGLAAAAVTAGMVMGIIVPGMGDANGDADDQLAGLWLEGSVLHIDGATADLTGIWLDAATSEEADGS